LRYFTATWCAIEYVGVDPAAPGADKTVYTEVSRHGLGDVVCSFNPALAGQR
jgi:hypothetical protein